MLARELSKKFETVSVHKAVRIGRTASGSSVANMSSWSTSPLPTVQSEIDPSVVHWLTVLLEEMPPSRAAAIAAKASGQSKSALYALALKLKSA